MVTPILCSLKLLDGQKTVHSCLRYWLNMSHIWECSSTICMGLQHTVSPTNINIHAFVSKNSSSNKHIGSLSSNLQIKIRWEKSTFATHYTNSCCLFIYIYIILYFRLQLGICSFHFLLFNVYQNYINGKQRSEVFTFIIIPKFQA